MQKINYKLSNGWTVDDEKVDDNIVQIEVSDEIAKYLCKCKTEDETQDRYTRKMPHEWQDKPKSLDMMMECGEDYADTHADTERIILLKEKNEAFWSKLSNHLSKQQIALLQAFYVDGKKQIEIADELKIKQASISGQLKTIHKKLKKIKFTES